MLIEARTLDKDFSENIKILIQNVPILICAECREQYYDAKAMKNLNKITEEGIKQCKEDEEMFALCNYKEF